MKDFTLNLKNQSRASFHLLSIAVSLVNVAVETRLLATRICHYQMWTYATGIWCGVIALLSHAFVMYAFPIPIFSASKSRHHCSHCTNVSPHIRLVILIFALFSCFALMFGMSLSAVSAELFNVQPDGLFFVYSCYANVRRHHIAISVSCGILFVCQVGIIVCLLCFNNVDANKAQKRDEISKKQEDLESEEILLSRFQNHSENPLNEANLNPPNTKKHPIVDRKQENMLISNANGELNLRTNLSTNNNKLHGGENINFRPPVPPKIIKNNREFAEQGSSTSEISKSEHEIFYPPKVSTKNLLRIDVKNELQENIVFKKMLSTRENMNMPELSKSKSENELISPPKVPPKPGKKQSELQIHTKINEPNVIKQSNSENLLNQPPAVPPKNINTGLNETLLKNVNMGASEPSEIKQNQPPKVPPKNVGLNSIKNELNLNFPNQNMENFEAETKQSTNKMNQKPKVPPKNIKR